MGEDPQPGLLGKVSHRFSFTIIRALFVRVLQGAKQALPKLGSGLIPVTGIRIWCWQNAKQDTWKIPNYNQNAKVNINTAIDGKEKSSVLTCFHCRQLEEITFFTSRWEIPLFFLFFLPRIYFLLFSFVQGSARSGFLYRVQARFLSNGLNSDLTKAAWALYVFRMWGRGSNISAAQYHSIVLTQR